MIINTIDYSMGIKTLDEGSLSDIYERDRTLKFILVFFNF
jgi:hypothetical protein